MTERDSVGLPELDKGIHYIESSLLVAALVEEEPAAMAALDEAGRPVTSALTIAEATRAILRARLSGRLTVEQERAAIVALRDVEQKCSIVDIGEGILARAGRAFPVEPVRTLDAIHLATVEALGEPPPLVTVLTRDARVHANAIALGYAVA